MRDPRDWYLRDPSTLSVPALVLRLLVRSVLWGTAFGATYELIFDNGMSASAEPAAAAAAAADVAPIEGVTLETWAAVEAGTARERVPPAEYDAYAQTHGVPAGRWVAISAAWQAQMMSDWRVGAKMGEAVEAAKKRR